MESNKLVNQKEQEEKPANKNQRDISSLSDFELAGIVCNAYFIKKISGEFYYFNGTCYAQADDKLLNQLVLTTFWNEQKQIRSTRKVRAIVDAIHMLNFVDDKESTVELGFENGILNIPDWNFIPFPLSSAPQVLHTTYVLNTMKGHMNL